MNNQALHDINMGYVSPRNLPPHQSVKFFPSEVRYYHPFSYESIGEYYGTFRLDEYLPLRDYLELPANCADTLVKAVQKGREKRLVMEKEHLKEEEEKQAKNGGKRTASESVSMDALLDQLSKLR